MTGSLIKGGKDIYKHRGEGDVKIETEIGVMLPQAKECREPLEARRVRKDYLLEPLEGVYPASSLILNF